MRTRDKRAWLVVVALAAPARRPIRVSLDSSRSAAMLTPEAWMALVNGPSARVTVSPPWQLSGMLTCGPVLGQCMVKPSGMQFIVVMTDVDAPPARNVIIESQSDGATCP